MKYIRMNQVEAEPMTIGEVYGSNIPDGMSESDDGYRVTHPDGFVSWSPKNEFEAVHRLCDGMTFGMAIEAMKRGKKVQRKGWNSKGTYIWFLTEADVKREWRNDERFLKMVGDLDTITCIGSIHMLTADKRVLTGWLASQTDMLAEDWQIVE